MLARVKLPALFVAVVAIGCLSWRSAEAQQTWDQCMQGCKIAAQHCIILIPRSAADKRNNEACDERLRECRHNCNR